mgnify:CR=1 FL=1
MKDVKIIELEAKGKKTIKMLDYNRPINRSLVNKLKESMKKYGILSAITVYETENECLVIDGQHRWTAASELDMNMPAISIGWDAMDAIVEMNTIQVNWTMSNFVDFFSAHKNPEISKAYKALKKKKEECVPVLTYSSLAKIYGKPFGGVAFKKGQWRMIEEERGDRFVKQLGDLVEHLPYAYSARFIYAYTDAAYHEDYNHKRMMKKFKRNHGVSLITSSNPKNYGIMLTKVYNFHQSKNLVMFKASWI